MWKRKMGENQQIFWERKTERGRDFKKKRVTFSLVMKP